MVFTITYILQKLWYKLKLGAGKAFLGGLLTS